MFKRVLMLIIIICAAFVTTTMAEIQIDDQFFLKLETGQIEMMNPFQSQLPVIQEPEAEKPKINQPVSDFEIPEETIDEEHETAEPTEVPIVVPERPVPIVIINGIIWNSDRPQAIVDGKIFGIGDIVSEIRIIDIQKTGIIGQFDGRDVTIPYK
ncbi:MAG: hypothetical protein JW847_03460 [Candidatus Omnitrophica bacterium]|nr:hypothetical protein [Candidatus Omnitrophota bacterium]